VHQIFRTLQTVFVVLRKEGMQRSYRLRYHAILYAPKTVTGRTVSALSMVHAFAVLDFQGGDVLRSHALPSRTRYAADGATVSRDTVAAILGLKGLCVSDACAPRVARSMAFASTVENVHVTKGSRVWHVKKGTARPIVMAMANVYGGSANVNPHGQDHCVLRVSARATVRIMVLATATPKTAVVTLIGGATSVNFHWDPRPLVLLTALTMVSVLVANASVMTATPENSAKI